MNEREHVLNALLVGGGVGYLLEPGGGPATLTSVWVVAIPVLLGALFPDVDGHFGDHRKTFHNAATIGLFAAFPYVVGNLQWVWLGVLTHYVLDVLGTTRGIAAFYPLSREEYALPIGVPVDSRLALVVTLLVTVVELAAAYLVLLGLSTAPPGWLPV